MSTGIAYKEAVITAATPAGPTTITLQGLAATDEAVAEWVGLFNDIGVIPVVRTVH